MSSKEKAVTRVSRPRAIFGRVGLLPCLTRALYLNCNFACSVLGPTTGGSMAMPLLAGLPNGWQEHMVKYVFRQQKGLAAPYGLCPGALVCQETLHAVRLKEALVTSCLGKTINGEASYHRSLFRFKSILRILLNCTLVIKTIGEARKAT